MNSDFQMLAKTFKGMESVLAEELRLLGAQDIQVERRAVSFCGDKTLMYKANLWLRTASRVLVPISTFKAKTADEIYESVKRVDWEQYLSLSGTFAIDTTLYSESFNNSRFLTYRVKDAVADHFYEKYGKRPNVRVDGADLLINVHVSHDKVTISLDSSGESLHKRGYRTQETAAPLNEALAAGLLLQAGWQGNSDFCDPMCGSGTLLIEAALIALNIPPGIYRQGFGFEKWKDFDRDLFEELYNDDSAEREFKYHIYGSDSSYYAVRAAEKNIRSANLQKYISVRQCQMQATNAPSEGCLVVMNPPYGERLLSADNKVERLYEEMGTTLKHRYAGCTAWLLSSNMEAVKKIGLRPTNKLRVLNGDIECLFLKYELFSGKRVDKLKRENE